MFVLKTCQSILDIDGQLLNVDKVHTQTGLCPRYPAAGLSTCIKTIGSDAGVLDAGVQEDVDEVGLGPDLGAEDGQEPDLLGLRGTGLGQGADQHQTP